MSNTYGAGSYAVEVTNSAGSVTSAVATLTVNVPPPTEPGQFNGICRLTNGGVQLSMSGTPQANYIIQWTSDWVGWSNLCTVSGTNGLFLVVDPCATNVGERFYRVRSP